MKSHIILYPYELKLVVYMQKNLIQNNKIVTIVKFNLIHPSSLICSRTVNYLYLLFQLMKYLQSKICAVVINQKSIFILLPHNYTSY